MTTTDIMPAVTTNIRRFLLAHDEAPAFHATYLAMIFLTAVLLNVGAFAVLVLLHAMLDIAKYRHAQKMSFVRAVRASCRESVVDIALLMVALCFAVYLHHATSIVAVSGALHIEQTLIRGFGMILPRMEVLFHNVRALTGKGEVTDAKSGTKAAVWKLTEKLSFLTLILASILVLVSPFVLGDQEAVLRILAEQMIPWRI